MVRQESHRRRLLSVPAPSCVTSSQGLGAITCFHELVNLLPLVRRLLHQHTHHPLAYCAWISPADLVLIYIMSPFRLLSSTTVVRPRVHSYSAIFLISRPWHPLLLMKAIGSLVDFMAMHRQQHTMRHRLLLRNRCPGLGIPRYPLTMLEAV